ncbi:MAG: histidine phosphatase family protein [Pelagimonas sp.]|uniref:histidine phosphatase family protein n=1 Tax=Pelagimonas sp. TaxID=2073170 RepID=UPI003D6A3CA6
MQTCAATELHFIRHAPVIGDGRVYGRRDVAADCSDSGRFDTLRDSLPDMDRVLCSPALRCVQTLRTLWPNVSPVLNDALWEQDLGDWEDQAFSDLPDIGALDGADLAAFAPPQGESFDDLCARILPILRLAQPGHTAIIAHAGTIRAALSIALGHAPHALRFEIDTLSVTTLSVLPKGVFGIKKVNSCC